VTLGTVGYGDMFPVTPMGKLIGSFVVILGIGLFALPTGILASGFAEVLAKRKEEKQKERVACPHCGRFIGDPGFSEKAGALEEPEEKLFRSQG